MLSVLVPTNVVVEPYMGKLMISDVVDPVSYFKSEENFELIEIVDDPNYVGNFLDFIYYLEENFSEDETLEILDNIYEKVTMDSIVGAQVIVEDSLMWLECKWDIDLEDAIEEVVEDK